MENQQITVYQKKSSTLLYIVSSVFACIFSVYMLFNLKAGDDILGFIISTPAGAEIAKVIFGIAAALFAYEAVFFIKRLLDHKPLIIADEKGFTDNRSNRSTTPVGFIPWRDVKRIYMVTMRHNKLIQVELTYPEAYLNRLSGMNRKAAEANIKMGYQAICFSLNGTDKNSDKFLAELNALWEIGHTTM